MNIKLYPQDNWSDVIAAYVRKQAVPSMFEVLGNRNPVNVSRSAANVDFDFDADSGEETEEESEGESEVA